MDLFHNPLIIDEYTIYINNLPQKDIIHEMMDHPNVIDVQKLFLKTTRRRHLVLIVFPLGSFFLGVTCPL